MCAQGQGSYSVRFAERSGTCGPLSEQIVVIQPNMQFPANCGGTWTVAGDNCSIDLDIKCLDAATGQSGEDRGHLVTNADASMVSGVLQFIVTDRNGIQICSSTYNVTYIRL